MEHPDIERKLSGRTLQVYLYLQRKKGPSGIREVQRDLDLSSPSVADYQIEKLVGMGLVAKDEHGRAYVTRKVRVKALDSYVSFGRFSVPRLAFYASMFSAVAMIYVVFSGSSSSIYGVAVPAAAAAVLWAEAWKMRNVSLTERTNNAMQSERQALFQMLIPGIVAAAVFASAGSFLFQYSQQGSAIPVPISAPGFDNRLTPEESAEMSHQKVAAVGGVSGISEAVLTGMVFASAGVMGFLVYVATKYGSVLKPERFNRLVSGTQDYPSYLQ